MVAYLDKGAYTTDVINDINDPEVFLALKKICKYLVDVAWQTDTIGSGEAEAEFNLAVQRTKRYEQDIKMLAKLDAQLAWGQAKRKTKEGLWVTTGGHDLNPWYEGSLTLHELLGSLESLFALIIEEDPLNIQEAEFIHYYFYLQNRIPRKIPRPAVINLFSLHPKIKEHCTKRFSNGQYSDAILAAYKVVLSEIKDITQIYNLDGKKLVEKAFSLEAPIIKLNALATQSDKDEQVGFMLLFSGAAIGIRNPKAHDLVEQDDKYKTLYYLAFASLLLERLDNRTQP